MRLLLPLLLLLAATAAVAQPTVWQSLNDGWQFQKGNGADFNRAAPAAGWEPVTLPHTWNAQDAFDDAPGYYRGAGWYRRTLPVPAGAAGRRVYLEFGAANQVAEVYVNGQKAGEHRGGYTAFRVRVDALLRPDPAAANEVLVRVDNAYNADLAPLTADFTFYGGLYRRAWLLTAGPVHFDLDDHAGPGLRVSTPAVSAAAATVRARAALVNGGAVPRRVVLTQQVLDSAGQVVARQQTRLTLAPGPAQVVEQTFQLTRPRLWSPARPYLYRVVASVTEAGRGGAVLDETSSPLGLRWFRFDAAQGFLLNGQPLKLIGASRHQDYAGLGNAVPPALAVRDVQLLKEMGGNFLRVAHYPQDAAVLDACDQLGVLVSEEIPVVNQITESAAFAANCRSMLTEMIRQHYNHPSVVLWAYMNEVLLSVRGQKLDDEPGRRYLGSVARLARQLDSLTRREDPGRATLLAMHGDFNLYHQAGLTTIPQVVGWNLYNGWYSAGFGGLDKFLDHHREVLPDKPLLISEYGADADPRLAARQPLRFDKTLAYAVRYHQYYLDAIRARPFVAGAAVWNLADFGSEGRQEATPHVNAKGLLSFSRQPKDDYYLYQAWLLARPFVRLGGHDQPLRGGAAGPDSLTCGQEVVVFTNQPTATLTHNGRPLGTRPAEGGVARFRVYFVDGANQLEASAGPVRDALEVTFQLTPADLRSAARPFRELSVSLGDLRSYADPLRQQVWLPEQAYRAGSWGYVGGRVFVQANTSRVSYGSDRDVLGTDDDPVFETQRIGLTQFRADVPAGDYEVTLHFAELEYLPAAEKLAYNLDRPGSAGAAPATPAATGQRSFSVQANGQLLLPDVSPATGLLPQQALSHTVRVTVAAGQGLTLDFTPRQGEAILNGIQIRRR